jgi:hypothetical protein
LIHVQEVVVARLYVMDFDGGTAAQYDGVLEEMGLTTGVVPDGAVFHYAGPGPRGWRVVDCWADPAAFDRLVLPDGKVPEAIVHHVNGSYDGGSFVVDSWVSQAEHDAFMEVHVRPNVPKAEVSGEPQFMHMEVHNQMAAQAPAPA